MFMSGERRGVGAAMLEARDYGADVELGRHRHLVGEAEGGQFTAGGALTQTPRTIGDQPPEGGDGGLGPGRPFRKRDVAEDGPSADQILDRAAQRPVGPALARRDDPQRACPALARHRHRPGVA